MQTWDSRVSASAVYKEVVLVEACKRNIRVEVSMHGFSSSASVVQMDQQFEFLITFVVALAIDVAKEDHLPPFTLLLSAEHGYSGVAPPTHPSSSGWHRPGYSPPDFVGVSLHVCVVPRSTSYMQMNEGLGLRG